MRQRYERPQFEIGAGWRERFEVFKEGLVWGEMQTSTRKLMGMRPAQDSQSPSSSSRISRRMNSVSTLDALMSSLCCLAAPFTAGPVGPFAPVEARSKR